MTPSDRALTAPQMLPAAAKQRLDEFWRTHKAQITAVMAGKPEQAEALARTTYSVLYRNPKLISCTPFSLLNGIVLGHQLGLVFGTQEIALVPFNNEATVIIQYQGKVKLALGSKLITSIEAELVYDCDEFEWGRDASGLRFKHTPDFKARRVAGPPTDQNLIGAYCQFQTAGGGVQTRFCDLGEILNARSRSRGFNYQKSKGGTDNPWFTDFGAMALKTAVHRAMKFAPQDMRMALATAVEDEEQGGAVVVADGLNPAEFGDNDLYEPLAVSSHEAQGQIVEAKLAGSTSVQSFDQWPDDQVAPSLGLAIKVAGKLYTRTSTDQTWTGAKGKA